MTALDKDAAEEQLVEIGRLTDRLGQRPGLKDGFSGVISETKFRLLFSASWILAEPHGIPAPAPQEWARIRDPAELDCWQLSWKEAGSPTDANVFTPALLSDPDMHIYGRPAGGGFDAGCIVIDRLRR